MSVEKYATEVLISTLMCVCVCIYIWTHTHQHFGGTRCSYLHHSSAPKMGVVALLHPIEL